MAKFTLKNVRLSFPSLFQKAVFNGTETKFEATFLLNKEEHADIIKVNVHEAAAVLGLTSDQIADPAAAAQLLHDRREHGWLTVVTAGALGAWAIADGPMYHAVPGDHGAFPVGSGDSFLAGLVTGLKESSDNLAFSIALATAAASANAQVPGVAVFDAVNARDLSAHVEVREL